MRNDFAVFILSHGRADRIFTLKALEKGGYTGKTYIVIDDEDKTADDYYARYGDDVIMFSKKAYDGKFDIGDNMDDRRVVVYARNAIWDIAEKMKLTYFCVLDDDYNDFMYRIDDGEKNVLKAYQVKQLDNLFDEMLLFLEKSGAKTICFAQGGDYIGGVNSRVYREKLSRKAMNSWFFKTDRRFKFVGRINEDVNTYVYLSNKGELFFTLAYVSVNQPITQTNAGGLTDIYVDKGTYLKSFYSVLYAPQAVKISQMGWVNYRIHHRVNWKYCTPQILSEKYQKF